MEVRGIVLSISSNTGLKLNLLIIGSVLVFNSFAIACQALISFILAGVGDVISAKFYAPASEQNGYYDRIYEKLAMVEP